MNTMGCAPPALKPCRHDSTRRDGTLDCHCLRCGKDGYWHDGHRHDEMHPAPKILFRLECPAYRADHYCVKLGDQIVKGTLTKIGARWLAWRLRVLA